VLMFNGLQTIVKINGKMACHLNGNMADCFHGQDIRTARLLWTGLAKKMEARHERHHYFNRLNVNCPAGTGWSFAPKARLTEARQELKWTGKPNKSLLAEWPKRCNPVISNRF
jgi:hypothetical protein